MLHRQVYSNDKFDALAFKWCCRWTEEREQWSQLILGTQSTRQCLLVQQETRHIRPEHHQPPAAVWWGAETCLHQETTHHHHHLGGALWQGGHDQTLSIITRSCLVTETSHWAAPVGQELILEQHFLISEENFSNTAIIVSCNKTVMEKKKIYCSTKLLTYSSVTTQSDLNFKQLWRQVHVVCSFYLLPVKLWV